MIEFETLNNTKNAHFAQAFSGVTKWGIECFITFSHKPKIQAQIMLKPSQFET